MKAICVTPDRALEVRDIPMPEAPPAGHVLVDMDSSAITHGDKFFLTRPPPGTTTLAAGRHDVYGANGAGRIAAIGAGVPGAHAGKQVAIYKSLGRSPDNIGVWCERAQLPYTSCLILPDDVRVRDCCGSLANILTVHAFLAEIAADKHKGIIVTAGTSATGYVAASLARRRNVPAIFLVRSASSRDDLVRHGMEHVIVTSEESFEDKLAASAAELGTTAVFDGVGGGLLNRILPSLPIKRGDLRVRVPGRCHADLAPDDAPHGEEPDPQEVLQPGHRHRQGSAASRRCVGGDRRPDRRSDVQDEDRQ